MLLLANDQLTVSILEPIRDRVRLGSRYVTGGYVYDVTDRRLGVITSGPGYPDEVFPPVFDGQGLPEAFPTLLWPGVESAPAGALPEPGARMLVIGVGLVTATTTDNFRVMPVDEFCDWRITASSTAVRMETRQSLAGWTLELSRNLRLTNRTLISETRLANVGRDAIRFRWFPHPFFPNVGGEFCKFNLPIDCPENPGYQLLDNGFITARPGANWDRTGIFQALPFTPTDRLVTIQRHPTIGLLTASCSYVPGWLPIWGNKYTFSFEPYLEQTVASGAESAWSIAYDF